MKTGLGDQAYTIVEALIFLAVTSAFFVLIAATLSGQQARTEFTQATRDFESKLLDIANDINTGYFALSSGISCDSNPGTQATIVASGTPPARGTNANCVVVGQIVRFTPDSPLYEVIPVVGSRRPDADGYPREIKSLAEARPVAIIPGSNPPYNAMPNASVTSRLDNGLVFKSARYNSTLATRGLLFASTFQGYNGSTNDLETGTIQADAYPLPDTTFDLSTLVTTSDAIRLLGQPAWDTLETTLKNPQSGIVLCFQQGQGTSRHAEITLGGNGRSLTTKVEIVGGACP